MSESVKIGTCANCGNELLLVEDDCWHAWDKMPVGGCPPEEFNKELGFKWPLWGTTGRPGKEYWRMRHDA